MGDEVNAQQELANAIAADDAAIEEQKAPETKPEDAPKEPQVEPDGEKPTGETQGGESVEDIKQSRAYHQQKSQEETERRKALEAELLALHEQLAAADGSKDFDFGGAEEPASKVETTPTKPAPGHDTEYEIDENSEVGILLKELKAVKQQIADMDAATKAEKAEKARVAKMVDAFKGEVEKTNTVFDKWVAEKEIPTEIVEAAKARACRNLLTKQEDYYQLGMPSRISRLTTEFLVDYLAQTGQITRKAAKAEADKAKVEAAKNAAAPSGAGVLAPGPEMADYQKKAADDIAPDDPPI